MKREYFAKIICGIIVSFCVSETQADNNNNMMDIVVIGTRANVAQLPASGDFIETEDIRDHSIDNLHQALLRAPGVYVQEETGYGLLPNVSLRGVDSHRSQKITLMEDGILTAPAPYSAPSAYYAPTVGRMSGLEVLKGSSQIKYGPHTTGGVLNYLSTPIPSKKSAYTKFLFGSFDEFRIHSFAGGTVSTDVGELGGIGEIHYRQTDGFKTIKHKSGDVDETGLEKIDYMLKLAWDLSTDMAQRIELKLGYTDFEADETYLGLSESDFNADPFQRYYASRFDNFSGEHTRVYLKHFIEIDDSKRLTSTLYYNKYHRNWWKLNDIKDVNGLPSGTISMSEALASGGSALATLKGENAGTLRIRANNRDYDMWGAQTALDTEFRIGQVSHAVESGLRYHTDEAKRYQWQDEYSVDNDGAVTSIAQGSEGGAGNHAQKAQALAVFAQDSIEIANTTVIPGIRYEHLNYSYTDYNGTAGEMTSDENVAAGGIAIKQKLSDSCIAFASIYRGYSVPSPKDNITKGLEEEKSVSSEIGARVSSESAAMQIAAFYTEIDDMIVGGYVGGPNDTDAENAGNVDVYGLEFSIAVDSIFQEDAGFSCPVWLAATYTHATLDGDTVSKDPSSIFSGGKDGNEVPYIPEFQVAIGFGMAFTKFDWEVTAKYVDEVYSTASNTETQINPVTGAPDARFGKIDSRVVLNASAHYDIKEEVTLFVNVYNLLDKEYMASRHPHGPRPGQPLTAMAGVEMSF